MNGAQLHFTDAPEPLPPYQRHSETSRKAAQSITVREGTMRYRVLQWFADRIDGTDLEAEDELGMKGSTVRPRRIKLVEDGLLTATGEKRPWLNGNDAAIWKITQAGRAALEASQT